jgi:hypothetical protein
MKPLSFTGLTVLFLMIYRTYGQKPDTSLYLPQITLTATNGFGPYVIGSSQENTFLGYDLPLSPQLHLRFAYETDSIANYYIPYIVYPDTVSFFASAGWGPFITNNYTFSDTSWHPVPQLKNSFFVRNLPPRTDTVIFQILTADSSVFLSYTVTAPPGQYLDSAVYPSVRMDNLPLILSIHRANQG